ncbi:CopG family transcriptional regulator [filamentous cyanobacterium LEGE 11480]|uniref:CopG family transcriptional regulator n=2 Tax=Romeriopsis TaxID=2992131 RepID=A0A928Z4Q6_9CYAN|nr:CopG family transcriptional regulator [Romeriopsis navalis LEGE 11480]
MQAVGFTVEDNITENLDAIKKQHNLPNDLAACHTAIAAGYVIEGHIPAADIQRLLAEKPKIAGIAVPGMPIGSPGMESGNIRESYATYSFTKDGKVTIFQEHPA